VSHLEILESELRRFELEISPPQKTALARYCDELVHWNKRINLTGLSGADMVRRLVVEPVWIARQLELSGVLVDIGSGNGSPAIPLHVLSPPRETHLVESRGKRAAFLRHLLSALQLTNVAVHRARFEELAASGTIRADWISIQAVSLTPQLIKSIRQIAKETTTVVWITSQRVQPPLQPELVLEVPITASQVFLFQLDLS
jgi:16S rRNA (guanine527-N7)-methyltransferase